MSGAKYRIIGACVGMLIALSNTEDTALAVSVVLILCSIGIGVAVGSVLDTQGFIMTSDPDPEEIDGAQGHEPGTKSTSQMHVPTWLSRYTDPF